MKILYALDEKEEQQSYATRKWLSNRNGNCCHTRLTRKRSVQNHEIFDNRSQCPRKYMKMFQKCSKDE